MSKQNERNHHSWTTVGAHLKHLRSAGKCGLRELARRAEVSPGFICDLEKNTRGASDEVLTRIATVLGAPAKSLIRTAAIQRIAILESQIAELRRKAA